MATATADTMSIRIAELWRALTTAIRRRVPPLRAAVFCAAFLVAARMTPAQSYWSGVYQGLGLYVWWPIVVYTCALLFLRRGWLEHRRTGAPMYFPYSALLAVVMLFSVQAVLVTEWSTDRGVLWWLLVAVAGVLSALALAVAFLSYSHNWRRWTRSIIVRVEAALKSGSFLQHLEGSHPPKWGSPHCLIIVRGHYQKAKALLRAGLDESAQPKKKTKRGSQRPKIRALLQATIDAGSVLTRYLGLSWYDERTESTWQSRRADVFRELITLTFWARAADPDAAAVKNDAQIEAWTNELGAGLGAGREKYVTLLRTVFRLCTPGDGPRMPARKDIAEILALYHDLPREPLTMQGGALDLRRVVRDTWLPAALHSLDERVVFDVWLAMHDPADPLDAPPPAEDDPADAWMRIEARRFYERWASRTDPQWRDLLENRVAQAAAVVAHPPETLEAIEQKVLKEAANAKSWPYLHVWLTRRTMMEVAAMVLVIAALHTLLLGAALPAFLFNEVEAVRDRRAGHDYRGSTIQAIASSDRTLALATGEGLQLFDKASRVIHPKTRQPVHDVTRGVAGAEFIVLGGDHSIFGVTAGGADQPWLPPSDPYWRGITAQAPVVIGSQFDRKGWLVALQDRGIARYTLREDGKGELFRTRSWQQSPLSSIPLEDAIFTESGVWLRADKVSFANRETLAGVLGRTLDEKLRTLDADPHGDWAAGSNADGKAWLFGAGRGWKGPYFCRGTFNLTGLSEVTSARFAFGSAWMGTRRGLFRYDRDRRCLSTSISGEHVRTIEPLTRGRQARVLVATNRALSAVDWESGYPESFDHGDITSLSIDPGERVAFYRRRTQQHTGTQPASNDVCRLPLDQKSGEIVLRDAGWRHSYATTVFAVRPAGDRQFFVTDNGAFHYDPRSHTYTDASLISANQSIHGITSVETGANRIAVLANGRPYAIAPGESFWTELDPKNATHPRQLAVAGRRVFGLEEADGAIDSYDGEPAIHPRSRSDVLVIRRPPSNTFEGDVLRSGDEYRFALRSDRFVAEFSSLTGELSDRKGETLLDNAVQLRYAPTGELLVLHGDGSVAKLGTRNLFLFGWAGLPYSLQQATALAIRDGVITVGGPTGMVFAYDRRRGAWPRLLASTASSAPVASIQHTSSGMVIGGSDGQYWYAKKHGTPQLLPYRRVVTRGDDLVALGDDGIRVLSPSGSDSSGWEKEAFAAGPNVRSLLSKVTFVWQRNPTSLVFLTAGAGAVEYDVEKDSWKRHPLDLANATEFQLGSDGVWAIDRSRIVRIGDDLRARQITFSGGETPLSLHVTTDRARTAFARSGELIVETVGATSSRQTRGGSKPPVGFDPARVVFAATGSDGRTVVMADDFAHLVAYDPAAGQWRSRHVAASNEHLLGWTSDRKTLYTRVDGIFRAIEAASGASRSIEAKDVPPDLETPRDGVLVATDDLRITCRGGASAITRGGSRLASDGLGFPEDRYVDAAVTTSGEVWALTVAGLVRFEEDGDALRPIDESRRLRGAAASLRDAQFAWLKIGAPEQRGVVAESQIGTRVIRWTRLGGAGVEPRWAHNRRKSALGTEACGKLVWQCIDDIVIDRAGNLLVASELGLQVRDAHSYALRHPLPIAPGARFIRRPIGGAVYVQTASGLRAWTEADKRLSPVKSLPDVTVAQGDWRWRFTANGISVTDTAGRPRKMTVVGGNWKFEEDRITGIERVASELILVTKDSQWKFDIADGRGDRLTKPVAAEVTKVETAAITITARSGSVTLKPLGGDDLPAIVDGRMFYDHTAKISASGVQGVEDLFTLVDGCCVLRRSGRQPREVVGAWRLPPGFAGALEPSPRGVRLREGSTARELNIATAKWTTQVLQPIEQRVASGAITWLAPPGRNVSFSPSYRNAPLASWWSGERFAWDRIHDLAVLGTDVVVFASAAGNWIGRYDKVGWTMLELDPRAVTSASAEVAYRNGKRVGVIVTSDEGKDVVAMEGDRPRIRGYLGPPFERPVIGFSFADRRSGDRVLTVDESWSSDPNVPAAASTAGQIVDGAFEFDGFDAAVPLGGAWWIATCPEGQQTCRLTRNSIAESGALELHALFSAPCISHLRVLDRGGLAAYCDRSETASRFDLASGEWTSIPVSALEPRLAKGDLVRFSTNTMSWEVTGRRYPWTTHDALSVVPRTYPLLRSSQRGVAFSFDELTAVTTDPDDGTMLIGTEGGVLRAKWSGSATEILRYGRSGTLDFSVFPIRRFRRSSDGDVWARLGPARFARATKPGRWQVLSASTWPEECRAAAGCVVELGQDGVVVRGQPIANSDNTWKIGDRPIADVVDIAADPSAVWIATRHNGLFKITR